MTTLTAGNGAASTVGLKSKRKPQKVLRERIGSTEFIISVHFSNTSKEIVEDKILRLAEREALDNA